MLSTAGVTSKAKTISSGLVQKIVANSGAGVSGSIMALASIPEFLGVFKSATMGYSRTGQKISGINWSSGIIEFFKATPKAAQYLIIPAALTGLAVGLGPIGATLGTILGLAIPYGFSTLWDKIFTPEEELIAQACKAKGIDLEKQSVSQPGGVLA